MALNGADILFLPHASPRGEPTDKLDSWMRHLTGRAFDNGVFVVACNQVGQNRENLTFPGVAVIIGPDGRIMESYAGDEEKILYAELREEDLKRVRDHRMRYFLFAQAARALRENCGYAWIRALEDTVSRTSVRK